MLKPQLILPIEDELLIDLFAGGGGASTGIEQATGRHVDIAVNHDIEAVAMHQANHPQTIHYVQDVFDVDPVAVCRGRPVGLLWASPDCKHFSKAKGGKPVEKRIRGLAWVIVKWAKLVRPRVIFLENVEEFQHWGPLDEHNMPCEHRKGRTFKRWKTSLENLGYKVDFREDRACDFGAPTIRKRLFLVARSDGQPIVFPTESHADPKSLPAQAKKLKPWRTAAECIDFSLPCPSIFERDRELAEATKRRIAKGVVRYVLQNPNPFIVNLANGDFKKRPGARSHSIFEPVRTIHAGGRNHALVAPTLMAIDNKGARTANWRAEQPLSTMVAKNRHALVTAFLAQHNNHRGTVPSTGRSAEAPISTITAKGTQQTLVAGHLIKLRGTSKGGQPLDAPLHTISAQGTHHAEVLAFLVKYYGTDQDPRLDEPMHTIRTKGHLGLATVKIAGEDYAIVDIGMRMLKRRELFNAQGFEPSYIIEWGTHPHTGERIELTNTASIRMCGNSVSPVMAKAYVLANYRDRQPERMAA